MNTIEAIWKDINSLPWQLPSPKKFRDKNQEIEFYYWLTQTCFNIIDRYYQMIDLPFYQRYMFDFDHDECSEIKILRRYLTMSYRLFINDYRWKIVYRIIKKFERIVSKAKIVI